MRFMTVTVEKRGGNSLGEEIIKKITMIDETIDQKVKGIVTVIPKVLSPRMIVTGRYEVIEAEIIFELHE